MDPSTPRNASAAVTAARSRAGWLQRRQIGAQIDSGASDADLPSDVVAMEVHGAGRGVQISRRSPWSSFPGTTSFATSSSVGVSLENLAAKLARSSGEASSLILVSTISRYAFVPSRPCTAAVLSLLRYGKMSSIDVRQESAPRAPSWSPRSRFRSTLSAAFASSRSVSLRRSDFSVLRRVSTSLRQVTR